MEQNEGDFKFAVMSINGTVAQLKFISDQSDDDLVQLYVHNALQSLYITRKWVNRAEERAMHE